MTSRTHRYPTRTDAWAVSETEILIRMWGEGASYEEIAAALPGRSPNSVEHRRWAVRLQARRRPNFEERPNPPEGVLDRIAALRASKTAWTRIATELGVGPSLVRFWARQLPAETAPVPQAAPVVEAPAAGRDNGFELVPGHPISWSAITLRGTPFSAQALHS